MSSSWIETCSQDLKVFVVLAGRPMVSTSVALTGDGLKLMLFDVASQKWREWATNLGTLGYLTWSPDSRYVGFDNFLTDDAGYMRISVADGKLERISSFKRIRRFWQIWGPWTGMAPDGSPLVVRDISTQEIYALDVDFPEPAAKAWRG